MQIHVLPQDLPRLLPGLLPGLASGLLFVLWIGLRGEPPANWQFGLLLAWFSLLAWIAAYRRYRFYADTPRAASIQTAPQGYVALEGIGRPLPGDPLRSPLNYLPCLWYRIRVERRSSNDKWVVETDECSDDSFVLEDRRGERCTIDPAGARVETSLRDQVREGDTRTTQWLLIPGTRINALGHFHSRRPIEDRAALKVEVRDRLADWKASGHAMRNFDADGNGQLDMQEWNSVREAAEQEIRNEREAAADFPAYHLLSLPEDGRPFVISDQPHEQVRRRYQQQAWLCLACFFLALSASAWLRTHSL